MVSMAPRVVVPAAFVEVMSATAVVTMVMFFDVSMAAVRLSYSVVWMAVVPPVSVGNSFDRRVSLLVAATHSGFVRIASMSDVDRACPVSVTTVDISIPDRMRIVVTRWV